MYKSFRRELLRKSIPCRCGNALRLIKRKNFTHGQNSVSILSLSYRCSGCKIERRLASPAARKLV